MKSTFYYIKIFTYRKLLFNFELVSESGQN